MITICAIDSSRKVVILEPKASRHHDVTCDVGCIKARALVLHAVVASPTVRMRGPAAFTLLLLMLVPAGVQGVACVPVRTEMALDRSFGWHMALGWCLVDGNVL